MRRVARACETTIGLDQASQRALGLVEHVDEAARSRSWKPRTPIAARA